MLDSKKFSFRIISVLRVKWEQGFFNVKARPFNALSMRFSGNAELNHDDLSIRIAKNQLLFMPKNYNYSVKYNKNDEIIVIHFDSPDLFFDKMEVFEPLVSEVFIDLFEKIYSAYSKKQLGSEYRVDALFLNILENIKIQRYKQNNTLNRSFSELVDYVHANFSNPEINIEMLAKIMKVSLTYLRKLFHRELGISPIKYINALRIERATNLLNSGYYTVEEVAELSGFNDPKYFSTIYKKSTGFSPIKVKNKTF